MTVRGWLYRHLRGWREKRIMRLLEGLGFRIIDLELTDNDEWSVIDVRTGRTLTTGDGPRIDEYCETHGAVYIDNINLYLSERMEWLSRFVPDE